MIWLSECGIRVPPSVRIAQRVSETTRLRGVFAESRISRGELIAVVPHSSIITPRRAMRHQHQRRRQNFVAAAIDCADFFAAPARKELLTGGSSVWFSRDQILVASALTEWRWQREIAGGSNASSSWPPLDSYLALLPRSQPKLMPLSSLTSATPESARPLVDRFASPLDPYSHSSAGTANRGATAKLSIPSSSIDPNQVIVGSLHLTTEQQLGQLHHTVHELSRRFVDKLLHATASSQPHPSFGDGQRLREVFEWAHFMVRSRSVCPTASAGERSAEINSQRRKMSTFSRDDENDNSHGSADHRAQPLLIPRVDMMNHSMTSANVSACWNRSSSSDGGDDVLITATRDIEPGCELSMNYADYDQRARFMFTPDISDAAGGNNNSTAADLEPLRQLVRSQRVAGVSEDALSWRWQFGFDLPRAELDHTRELMWARSLRGRIRRMMETRRRGRPGEFVVGVPEGLASLRAQRARVERDLYGGKHVFPVQRS
jgi:hypothetical protein